MVLLADGTVWTKGANARGQLGSGSTTDRSTWAPVSGLSGVSKIAAAYYTGYALLSSGSVKAWGYNNNGQVGDGTTTTQLTPVQVSGLTAGVTQVAAGVYTGFALLSNGSVKAWGNNIAGQVGDGSTTQRLTPVQVSGLTSGVTQIASANYNGFALLSNGSVRAWGNNGNGQVGDGSTTQRLTPVQVSGLTSGVTQVAAAANNGYALLADGSVKAWGFNGTGPVGDGTNTQRLAPVQVSGLTSGVTQIAAGANTGYALLADGSVRAWGRNDLGQVGDGSTTNQLAPVSVSLPAGHVVQRLGTNAVTSYAAPIVMGETTLSVDVVETTIAAGSAATVRAMVQKASDSSGVSGAPVTLTATAGAVLAAVSGSTDAAGMFQTTVTPDVWTTPGGLVSVAARNDVSSVADTVSVLGSNVVVAGGGYSSVLTQSEVVFPSPVVDAVAAGLANRWFMVLLADGTVWTKGFNGRGQLGDGSTTARSTWAPVAGLSGVTKIAAALFTAFAVLSDGSLKAWGYNNVGQVGDGSTTQRLTPVQVSGLTSGVTQITASTSAGFALLSDGSVKAWGGNNFGQVGDGSTTNRSTPVPVSGLSGVTQIAAGSYNGYALAGGSVKAWGYNDNGQVGDGSTAERLTPVQVSGLSGVTRIAAGAGTGYALAGGSVSAWGINGNGQVGDGSTTDRLTPVQVSGLTSGVTQIATAANTGYALLSSGSVSAWGANGSGQVGDGSTTDRLTPVSVSLPSGRVAQRVGANSTTSNTALIVVNSAGTIVEGPPTVSVDIVQTTIAAGSAATVRAMAQASNSSGVAGASVTLEATAGAVLGAVSGSTDYTGVFQTTVTPDTWTVPGGIVSVTARNDVSSGTDTVTVLGSNVIVAGNGYASVMAQSELVFPSPVVDALAAGSTSAWFMVLLADGTVWTKGTNTRGQLGSGSTTDRLTWAPVAGLSGVTKIAAGFDAGFALLSDGSVRAWGFNGNGQVGDGSTTNRLAPVQVSGLTSGVTQIAAGNYAGYALLSDGSVRAWGFNDNGQVGDGSTTNRLTPVQVSGLSGVTQIASGGSTGYALASGGSVWAWGANFIGQVGDGTTTARLMPVQASGLTSGATQIAAGLYTGYASLSDGSVRAWGYNNVGQVGDGSTTDRLTPVQVTGLSGVTQIVAGGSTGYALVSGGSVKAWGGNLYGQVGDGSTTARLTPVSMSLPAGHVAQRLGANSSASYTAMIVMQSS
jgi:alpha-tubulin suppressor-like RCC1 family protein